MHIFMFFLALYGLWILYLAERNLERARIEGTLTTAARYLFMPVFVIGYLLDVILNITVFSLLVLDVPREWTITSHVGRILNTPITPNTLNKLDAWRFSFCDFLCRHLLDPFDPSGNHCGRPLPPEPEQAPLQPVS